MKRKIALFLVGLLLLNTGCAQMPEQEPTEESTVFVTEATAESTQPQQEIEPTLETQPQQENEPTLETQPQQENEPTLETQPQQETEPTLETHPQQETEPTLETQPQQETEPTLETQPQQETEPTLETQPQQETEPTLETQPQQETEPTLETQPQQETEPTLETQPQQETEPTTVTQPQQVTEPTAATQIQQETQPTIATQPQKVTEPIPATQPTMATEPTKYTQLPQLTWPTQPTKSTQAAQSTQATKPTQQATWPTQTVQPTQLPPTIATTQNTQLPQLTLPIQPTLPTQPTQSTTIQSAQPVEPVETTPNVPATTLPATAATQVSTAPATQPTEQTNTTQQTQKPTTSNCSHEYQQTHTKAATCTAEGSKKFTCKKCGEVMYQPIPLKEHSYAAATCLKPKTCSVCFQTEGSALGHTYGDTHTCIHCGVKDPSMSPESMPVTFEATVRSEEGTPISGIQVTVYTAASGINSAGSAATNQKGVANIALSAGSATYTVKLSNVPEEYSVQTSYSFSSAQVTINLKVRPVRTDPKDHSKARYEEGDEMMEFTMTDVDGKTYKLSELIKSNKLVILDFWYVNCNPCKQEFPYFEAALKEYGDDIVILAVDPFYSAKDIRNLRDEMGLTFPLFQDPLGLAKGFGVETYPTTVFIDNTGKIRKIHRNAFESQEDLLDMIDTFL